MNERTKGRFGSALQWTRREPDGPKIERGRPGTPFTVSGVSHDSWGSRSRAKPRSGSTRAVADPGREADDGRFTGKSTGRVPVVLGGAPGELCGDCPELADALKKRIKPCAPWTSCSSPWPPCVEGGLQAPARRPPPLDMRPVLRT